MAKQEGPYKFTGKLGGVVGREINGQYIVGKPGGFTEESWAEHADDEDYGPRKEANDFSASSSMAKSIYHLCDESMVLSHRDSGAYNRLVSHFQKFRIFDRQNAKGSRRPTPGAFHHLVGFSLNKRERIFARITPSPTITDTEITYRISGAGILDELPTKANAVEWIGYSAEVDFSKSTCLNPVRTSLFKNYDELRGDFEFTIPRPSKNCLSLMAIQFHLNMADYPYPLSNKKLSPYYVVGFRE